MCNALWYFLEYYFFLKNASHTHETEWTVAICFEIPAPNFRWSELCASLSEPASFLRGESPSGPSVFPVRKLDDHHHAAPGRFSPSTLGSQSALGEGSEDGGYLLPAPNLNESLASLPTKWTFSQSSWIQTLSRDEIYYPLVQSYGKVLSEKLETNQGMFLRPTQKMSVSFHCTRRC